MPDGFQTYKRKFVEVVYLALRHILLPINAVIFSVVILLVLFGNVEEGIFLGAVAVFNILLGFGQDVQAWLSLERLQVLTAVRAIRLNDDARFLF